jgi:hypothetical protein
MHIDNLYKNREVLLFKEVYAMEKIHGTSAHVSWKNGELSFFAGGVKQANFEALFNKEELSASFRALGYPEVVVYGEAYGGSCQGMAKLYGKSLAFVAFEVKVDEAWLNVPNAFDLATRLGFSFVDFKLVPATVEALDIELQRDSVQAVRNGMGEGHRREGIVIRPPIEVVKNNGARIIAKHKNEGFQETQTHRPLDPEALKVLEDAEKIAEEWVTPMRLAHVLDAFPEAGMEKTGEIIKAMVADVEREAGEEIISSPKVRAAIGKKTAVLFKSRLKSVLEER